MNIKTFSIGGIHPEENKLTHDAVTQVAALPKQAIFPCSGQARRSERRQSEGGYDDCRSWRFRFCPHFLIC